MHSFTLAQIGCGVIIALAGICGCMILAASLLDRKRVCSLCNGLGESDDCILCPICSGRGVIR